ncbi:MAG: NUDIX domain-containing protein [Chlamydiae bacterium]|nr:NUDIX domain-containing protein [Chlamydiota bacterium]
MDKDFFLRLIATAKSEGIERFVVGGVITNKKNEVLLLRRKKDDFMGGIHELPSGKVETSETLDQALKREVLEETNLKLKKIYSYISSFDYLSSSKKKTRQFNYHIEVEAPFKIKLSEHDSFAWVSLKNILNFNVTEEIKKIILQMTLEELCGIKDAILYPAEE